MYVDDSGTPRLDDTPFYVIAGVIININDLFTIEKELELFRKKYFHSKYKKEEIHVHEIYHSRDKFSELTLPDKYNILNGLYSTVSSLPFTIIAVGIQKEAMKKWKNKQSFIISVLYVKILHFQMVSILRHYHTLDMLNAHIVIMKTTKLYGLIVK